ncbi:MAG: hypothetical protein DCF29_15595 [Alphaproteobacteria bacterium]|nr:MAG: hypothetical protein DCF29_15595 [Alphaproteobacteria bacterium]
MRFIAFLLFCLLYTTSADAQCRMGSGPDLGDGIPYCSQLSTPPPALPSGPEWESRWGAIAVGSTVSGGGVGVASDMKTRRFAEDNALQQCRNNGGGVTCHIELAYANQCGVIVWGESYFETASGQTQSQAESEATELCSRKTTNCRLYYANCSYPSRVG